MTPEAKLWTSIVIATLMACTIVIGAMLYNLDKDSEFRDVCHANGGQVVNVNYGLYKDEGSVKIQQDIRNECVKDGKIITDDLVFPDKG